MKFILLILSSLGTINILSGCYVSPYPYYGGVYWEADTPIYYEPSRKRYDHHHYHDHRPKRHYDRYRHYRRDRYDEHYERHRHKLHHRRGRK